jgi:hypothetical protein
MHCFVCNKKAPGDRGFFILKTMQALAWCKPLLGASPSVLKFNPTSNKKAPNDRGFFILIKNVQSFSLF